jgi:hypothetical protein
MWLKRWRSCLANIGPEFKPSLPINKQINKEINRCGPNETKTEVLVRNIYDHQ